MKIAFLLLSLLVCSELFSQEICNNAIDDDGDGWIDLNDDECSCGTLSEITGVIPNPSFEDMLECPAFPTNMDDVETWVQASTEATSDYFNTCGMTSILGYPEPAFPLPGDGEGYAGFFNSPGGFEMVGAPLDSPLLEGVEYTLSVHTAWALGDPTWGFAIFGSESGTDLPWDGFACPVGEGDWVLLSEETITLETDGTWLEVIFTFTPETDITAIAFGGSCTIPTGLISYYYIDEISLIGDTPIDGGITTTGDWCNETLILSADFDTTGGEWQWYYEGEALLGETSATLDPLPYGTGLFSAVYTVDDFCYQSDYNLAITGDITADFSTEDICEDNSTIFSNTSSVDDGVDPIWNWTFGDGETSSSENPIHTYDSPGTYSVQLIASSEEACSDTVEMEVTVHPKPDANFEFIANGLSSLDGATGACVGTEIEFNDLSTLAGGGSIVSWNWDLGDGSTSSEEDPNHTYASSGSYTVTLVVESDLGCTSEYTLEVVITEGLVFDISFNEPTCFQFNDGSITLSVTGWIGDVTFEIANADGTILNIDNSNVANNLTSGWYYIHVSDDSECQGIDSVFIGEPSEMDIDLSVVDPACYGLETGYAIVNSVTNFTGDYDEISYIWSPNPAGNGGIGEDSTWAMGAGDYTITINDENGCSIVRDFTVNEPDSLFFTELGFEPAYCRLYDYQNGNGLVFAAASGGVPDYTYEWTSLEDGSTSNNTTWGGRNPGDYRITAIDENGCILETIVTVDSLNPIADFEMISPQFTSNYIGTAAVEVSFINQSLNYANPNDPEADTIFFWNLNHDFASWILTQSIDEELDTIYGSTGESYLAEVCLVAINKNGCADTLCKTIEILEPFLFENVNVFTPNNDGVNDVFTFKYRSASISEFYCTIVNRWGIVMAELDHIEDGWDGTNKNGLPCTDGVYFFKYEATLDSGAHFMGQGTVELFAGP